MEIVNGIDLSGFLGILEQISVLIYGTANSFFKLLLLDLKVFGIPIGIIFVTSAILSALVYTLLNSSSD